MPLDSFVRQGQTMLRRGFTTGTCATLGSKACAEMLLTKKLLKNSCVTTPKGIVVEVSLHHCALYDTFALCSVIKDGGDDIDVTHGAEIRTKVSLTPESNIQITGGDGVGIVTKKGLDQPVGAYAINSTPRKMILRELQQLSTEYQYTGGFLVEISVMNGAELAKKTFNPHLGIVGGLSILGTSGIVEPRSLTALVSSIEVEINMHVAEGVTHIILTPGNYGSQFLENRPILQAIPHVEVSNFIGDSLDFLLQHPFQTVLLVGHIGKLVKLAAGIMNTHSRYADGRVEVFAAYTALCGGSSSLIALIMESATCDACLTLLDEHGLVEIVMEKILESAQKHLNRRCNNQFQIGIGMFSHAYGFLGYSQEGKNIVELWEDKND